MSNNQTPSSAGVFIGLAAAAAVFAAVAGYWTNNEKLQESVDNVVEGWKHQIVAVNDPMNYTRR